MSKIQHSEDPVSILNDWLKEAHEHPDVNEPTAMSLATSSKDGKPSLRVVLAKEVNQRGIVFYTNLASQKGREIDDNNNVALCFYWMALNKQVRIIGKAYQIDDEEADQYFAARSRGSQLSAWASKQSVTMSKEDELDKRIEKIEGDFKNINIPRPPFWSGLRVVPESFEFWRAKDFRRNDRTLYSRVANGWVISKLYP